MNPGASTPDPQPERARVIASHGRHVVVETAGGELLPCTVRARHLQIVCGDEVECLPDTMPGKGIVMERLPRRSALARTNAVGTAEILVANITQVAVLCAPRPAPDFFIVDRYLAAAGLLGLKSAIAWNKCELSPPDDPPRLELQAYARAGYPVIECSARTGAGLDRLESLLRNEISVLVGQSGVGKSSLANCLVPGLEAATAALSRATAEGRHATSVSTLHHLPDGGDLVDSPGVRDFAPAIELLGAPAHGFAEIAAIAPSCRFADCRHQREPGCAVQAAVAAGDISPRRYESYRRLKRLSEELAPDPGRARRNRDK